MFRCKIILVVVLMSVLTGVVYAAEIPKEKISIVGDSYQRVVVKYNGDFLFEWSEDGKYYSCDGIYHKDKAVIDGNFTPNKTLHYYLKDTKTKAYRKGTFSIKRKFIVSNSKKELQKEFSKKTRARAPIIAAYSNLSSKSINSVLRGMGTLEDSLFWGWEFVRKKDVVVNGKKYILYKLTYIDYNLSASEQKKYINLVKKIKKDVMKGSTRQKLCRLNKWLTKHCRYDYSYNRYQPYDVALKRKAVCSGFSEFVAICCEEEGIPCKYIASQKANHAWNIVKVNGKWYHMDSTWDVCTKYGKWLLKGHGDSAFNKSHKIGSSFYKHYKAKKYFGKKNLSTKI